MARPDLTSRDDVITLVDAFYEQIRADPTLGPIFEDRIGTTWPSHLATMYDFWESILFRTGSYRGNPPKKHLAVHQEHVLSGDHFDRWIALFDQTLIKHFDGPTAIFASRAAADIARVLRRKLGVDGADPNELKFSTTQ